MTISYNLDVARSDLKGVLRLLFRWQGSVWKAVTIPLLCWTITYYLIFCVYHFILSQNHQTIFEKLGKSFEKNINTYIPLTFILGFFVSSVVSRWMSFLKAIGWIDNTAIAVSIYIRGSDDETRAIRRTMVRYMVLSQTLVLRDVSIQVRGRFPTLCTIEAAGLMTKEERNLIEETKDAYSRYWIPIQWTEELLYQARQNGKVSSDFILEKIAHEIHEFRHGLESLLKFDWVPIPLVYPQLVTFSVRLYFFIALFTRQYTKSLTSEFPESRLLWIPLPTMIQFIVYMGWLKVAEELLNPLGDDQDDLECNYIIDKNLTTGFTLVDKGGKAVPKPCKDVFWDAKKVAVLYTLDSAKRSVTPLVGSAINANLVKRVDNVTMVPHKYKLAQMTEEERERIMQKIDVRQYNKEYKESKIKRKEIDPDKILDQLKMKADNAFAELTEVHTSTPLLAKTKNGT